MGFVDPGGQKWPGAQGPLQVGKDSPASPPQVPPGHCLATPPLQNIPNPHFTIALAVVFEEKRGERVALVVVVFVAFVGYAEGRVARVEK